MKPKSSGTRTTLHIDGAGARPDGKGSAFAWMHVETGVHKVTKRDGLTNNQAEYEGLLSALQDLPSGSDVEVFTDSTLVYGQFNGKYAVRDPKLQILLQKARQIVQDRKLTVSLAWIPRSQNRAGKLL